MNPQYTGTNVKVDSLIPYGQGQPVNQDLLFFDVDKVKWQKVIERIGRRPLQASNSRRPLLSFRRRWVNTLKIVNVTMITSGMLVNINVLRFQGWPQTSDIS